MKPMWKQMFDAVEQAAGPAMADAAASDAFAEFAKVGTKISKDVNRQIEAASREWLHMWNLPAAGDVQYLKRQVGTLEGEIRSLQRQLERFSTDMLRTQVAPIDVADCTCGATTEKTADRPKPSSSKAASSSKAVSSSKAAAAKNGASLEVAS